MTDDSLRAWALQQLEKTMKRQSPVARMKALRAQEKKDFKKVVRSLAAKQAAFTRKIRQLQVDSERRRWLRTENR